MLALDGHKIGRVTKEWAGLLQETISDADNFSVTFPLDLDVKVKASLLAACLLIDFMFYEDNQVTAKEKREKMKKNAKKMGQAAQVVT